MRSNIIWPAQQFLSWVSFMVGDILVPALKKTSSFHRNSSLARDQNSKKLFKKEESSDNYHIILLKDTKKERMHNIVSHFIVKQEVRKIKILKGAFGAIDEMASNFKNIQAGEKTRDKNQNNASVTFYDSNVIEIDMDKLLNHCIFDVNPKKASKILVILLERVCNLNNYSNGKIQHNPFKDGKLSFDFEQIEKILKVFTCLRPNIFYLSHLLNLLEERMADLKSHHVWNENTITDDRIKHLEMLSKEIEYFEQESLVVSSYDEKKCADITEELNRKMKICIAFMKHWDYIYYYYIWGISSLLLQMVQNQEANPTV